MIRLPLAYLRGGRGMMMMNGFLTCFPSSCLQHTGVFKEIPPL